MTVRLEDTLARDGRLAYTCVRTSMLPMLRQRRDLLIIEKKEGRLKRRWRRAREQQSRGKSI